MANKKADNQWYGKGFEQAIYITFNHLPKINPYEDHIPDNEWNTLLKDAEIFLKEYNEPIYSCEWIGNITKNKDGDLLINNKKVIEVKRVSENKGTYLNTSWSKCEERYGFYLNSRNFLRDAGLYDELIKKFGKDKINILNESPVSEKMSSNIQKNEIEWYKKYSKKESIAREKLVSQVVTVLKNNPEVAAKFLSDIVSKNISCKKMPDQLIVYNHEQQKITFIYNNKELKNMCNDYTIKQTARQKLGFYLGNFRIQIGWQNGAGLNNPTIRAFIK